MQTKLQELTERLYNEGLSKGKVEGEQILSKAHAQAEEILSKAKAEAAAIIKAAEKEAEDLKVKAEGDVRMASGQAIQAAKKDLEGLVITRIADTKVDSALASADFVKDILKEVAAKFSAQESCDLSLVLPASMQKDLEPFVKNELGKLLGKDVEASFSKKIAGGFTIGPKEGGYFISLTDETFKELIASYLRPVTKKLLFG